VSNGVITKQPNPALFVVRTPSVPFAFAPIRSLHSLGQNRPWVLGGLEKLLSFGVLYQLSFGAALKSQKYFSSENFLRESGFESGPADCGAQMRPPCHADPTRNSAIVLIFRYCPQTNHQSQLLVRVIR
jgi:hypothetical protein